MTREEQWLEWEKYCCKNCCHWHQTSEFRGICQTICPGIKTAEMVESVKVSCVEIYERVNMNPEEWGDAFITSANWKCGYYHSHTHPVLEKGVVEKRRE